MHRARRKTGSSKDMPLCKKAKMHPIMFFLQKVKVCTDCKYLQRKRIQIGNSSAAFSYKEGQN